ncbi:similar to Saccharomyces cerevisiae YJL025W RRN7 Component of the core factor (CF) rDNA transcription factor complex [Maudiozyma saulgeensis]|uniref:Similar to Saccharomyces cerevisiae YJL025W RRN7 Component of the core factor (CF) rDNA transcription factor complex n=1 Tax=Maudiozyma saulgeensis TaxID=1789683 RepID=A0A1X7R8W6_9SACH|nr:similar to Saccharomyces cerevisiae YJL025W RRN7 Component of the core factor (CF) rDNA transcription factor complex [Kazachstania saulgeensis]
MSTFIRGPVCGIDNCPSQLWRIIAGRRTCQYGHVMEGDVEFNDDDDNMANSGVITRRLNLTTGATGNFQSSFNNSQLNLSQKTAKDKKVYGEKARKLFLRSFQYILRHQVTWLIKEQSFPEDFEDIVKTIWMEHLKIMNNDIKDGRDFFSNADNETSRYNTQEDSSDSSDIEATEPASGFHGVTKLKLSIHTMIAILYLSAVHLNLPVYINDFTSYICATTFPYHKANHILPKNWRDKLPNYYLGLLSGKKIPKDGQLINKIIFTCTKIHFTRKFNCEVNIKTLLLKLTLQTRLPPEFFLFTTNVIRLIEGEETFSVFESDNITFSSYHRFPEVRTISYFILCIRWILRCDESSGGRFKYPTSWIMSIIGGMKTNNEYEKNIEDRVTSLFYPSLENEGTNKEDDPYDWTDNGTSDFLDWVEKVYLGTNQRYGDSNEENKALTIDQKIAKRKLEKIVPLETDSFPRVTKESNPISAVEKLQENFIQLARLREIDTGNENTSQNHKQRLNAVSQLEEKLIHDIAPQFGFSDVKLKSAIQIIERHCITTLKH